MSSEKLNRSGVSRISHLEKVSPSIVYRLFNPQVPVVLCSKSGKDVAAMPANSCSSASDSPPMISVALRKKIRTNEVVRSSLRFSINWLNYEPASSRRVILDLAKPSEKGKNRDKLREYEIPYSLVNKVPVLQNACAFAVCKVDKRISTGDHDLFIASVVSAKALRDFTRDSNWRFKDYRPILYVGSIRQDPLITIPSDKGD